MYLTYDDYEDMGGTLDEATFELLEYEAESYVNWLTFNRLKNNMPDPVPDTLPYCMFVLIDYLSQKKNAILSGSGDGETQKLGSISHQDNDGVSVSYNILSARQTIVLADQEMTAISKRYLEGVRDSLGHKVLYRGIYPGE